LRQTVSISGFLAAVLIVEATWHASAVSPPPPLCCAFNPNMGVDNEAVTLGQVVF